MHHPQSISLVSTSRFMLLAAVMATGVFGAVACQNTSSPSEASSPNARRVDLSDDLTANASVVALDRAERLITLRREDGSMFTVEAGPAVRNFDQIALGDTLRVRYHESLAATLLREGMTTSPAEAAFAAGRAKPGEKPAAGVGLAARARVKIESVDRDNNIVVFSLDSGELRSVRAMRPEGREFIKNLKIGDIVQLDYTQSLALAIDKL